MPLANPALDFSLNVAASILANELNESWEHWQELFISHGCHRTRTHRAIAFAFVSYAAACLITNDSDASKDDFIAACGELWDGTLKNFQKLERLE